MTSIVSRITPNNTVILVEPTSTSIHSDTDPLKLILPLSQIISFVGETKEQMIPIIAYISTPCRYKKPYTNMGFSHFFPINYCSSCKKPGKTLIPVTHNASLYFSSCESEDCFVKCITMQTIEQRKEYVYGPLFHLRNDFVKIRRSNGIIDDGWKIHGGIILQKRDRVIYCTKETSNGNYIQKYVLVSIILELN